MYWDKISKYLNIKWLMPKSTGTLCCLGVMMFNGTFNNISVIWCMANSFIGGWNRSTLRNHLILPAASHWPTLPHIVSSTSYNDRDSNHNFRDRPFNLKGGYGFLFRSEFFFRTTQELEYYFFFRAKRELFFPEFNIRLYDKNSESDHFFFLHQIRIFFSATLGIRVFFFRKKHILSICL